VRHWKEELEKNDVSFPALQRIDERRKAIADAINFRVCGPGPRCVAR
jgi:hypothetical protein